MNTRFRFPHGLILSLSIGALLVAGMLLLAASASAGGPVQITPVPVGEGQPPPPLLAEGADPPSESPSLGWTQTTQGGYSTWTKTINSGCSYDDHNYTLDINALPSDMSDITYSMTNWDVDYLNPACTAYGPEVDLMYFNNDMLGSLTGADNSWSINTWSLTDQQVISGTNTIYIDTDSTRTPPDTCWCVGVGYIEVKAKVGFQVRTYTPQADDKNRDFHKDKLDLTVTFSTEYDTATLDNNTFKLEYREPYLWLLWKWVQEPGAFTQLAPNRFRFTPTADLKDGIKYRVTVKGGSNGVKAKNGGQLTGDTEWSFWTVPNLDLVDNYDYGSGSLCPPATAPCRGFELTTFQSVRNATMVPGGKPAVSRLYLRWPKHNNVYGGDQLTDLEVRASLGYENITYILTQTVKRPDKYSKSERESASNTINIYHTPQTTFNYTAEVTPNPQTNATPVKFTHTLNLASSGRSPNIRFDYYVLNAGNWAGGNIPPAARTEGTNLMTDGSQYINDMFPSISTNFDVLGDLTLVYTPTAQTVNEGACGTVREVTCVLPGTNTTQNMSELRCVNAHLNTMLGGHPFVAATVPNNLCNNATGFALGTVFMHQYSNGANAGTIAHEVGHIYGISTANSPNNGHRNDSNGVEGFQVRTQTNRSFVENPLMSVSLMHTTVQPKQWIHKDDYATLIGSVNLDLLLDAAGASTSQYLIVSGFVDSSAATAAFLPAFLQELPNTSPAASGTCRVSLLDAGNSELAGANVTPGGTLYVDTQQAAPAYFFQPQLATNTPAFFQVSLPWSSSAARLRITCGGSSYGQVQRSPNNPTVDFIGLTNGDTLSTSQAIHWTGSDLDANPLAYQLQFSPDSGLSWLPLTPLTAQTSFSLDTTRLPSGSNLPLRIMVSDGFNTAYAVRTVNIVNPLKVLTVAPSNTAANVGLHETVTAWFVSPVNSTTLSGGGFQLLEAGTTAVSADLTYDPQTRTATLKPADPLKPNTSYTAKILGTVQDASGNSLGADYLWSFTTEPDTIPPLIVARYPADGDTGVPLNALIQVEFNEAIDWNTLGSGYRLEDLNGNLVPATITYYINSYRAVYTPSAQLNPGQTYVLRVTTNVKDSVGNALESEALWSFTTGTTSTTSGVRIIGNYSDEPFDTNDDGLYDYLVIYSDVEVSTESYYNLNGRLIDKNNNLLQWQTTGYYYLYPGIYRLYLAFDSETIRGNGLNGPYTLDSLYFYDYYDMSRSDQRFNAYQTFAYNVTNFYGVLSLTTLPDQVLEWNTTRDNAFNLHDYTFHASLPVSQVTYSIFVNTNPDVGASIDANAYLDINPLPNTEAESDVTIKAQDPQGNFVYSTFHISVQKPRPDRLNAVYPVVISPGTTAQVMVTIYDQWDRVLTQPATVTASATQGLIAPTSQQTSTGQAAFTFTAPGTAGTAFLTFTVDNVELVIQLQVSGMRIFMPWISR
jgi:hypothetical protein